MNIFFITQWYPSPESPIAGIFVREHARAIAKFHQVFVIVSRGDTEKGTPLLQIKREEDDALVVFRIKYRKPPVPLISAIPRLIGNLRVFRQLISSGVSLDIIHANIYNTADIAAVLQRNYHLPAVLTEHTSAYPRKLLSKTQALKAHYFLNRLNLLMPVSKDLSEHMRQYGIRGPFFPVPNTVDTNIFFPGSNKYSDDDGIPRILAVASHLPVKRIDFLIRATSILARRGVRCGVILVGDGPERPNLEELSRHLNVGDRVTFLGLLNKHQVADIMRRVDIFALTSQWENQPAVLLEAMASGLPILASRVGGIPEIIQPYCGRLVESSDIEDIADNLQDMLGHLSEYSQSQISEYAQSRFCYRAVGNRFSVAYQLASGKSSL